MYIVRGLYNNVPACNMCALPTMTITNTFCYCLPLSSLVHIFTLTLSNYFANSNDVIALNLLFCIEYEQPLILLNEEEDIKICMSDFNDQFFLNPYMSNMS